MIKIAKYLGLAVVALLVCAVSASAQTVDTAVALKQPLISFPAAFGAGLVTMGAAYGIAKLAAAAYESMARQPEVAGSISTAMLIAAALIEGFTFFALFICYSSIGQ